MIWLAVLIAAFITGEPLLWGVVIGWFLGEGTTLLSKRR